MKENKLQQYINGNWEEGLGQELASYDPVSNQLLCRGPCSSPENVSIAVAVAQDAFISWSAGAFSERLIIINKFKDNLIKARDDLALTISKETGKPLWESRTEVNAVINKVDISLKSYHERTGEKVEELDDKLSVVRHRPHGVVAVFGAYNFPMHLPSGHIIPALLAGNTVVFKPSSFTPLSAMKLIECWDISGLPPGVINLVYGGFETSRSLVKSDIDGLFFTGSYKVGKDIARQLAADFNKILALELGGNNPLIIDKLTNVDAAVTNTLISSFITAGQRCTCARRLIIPDDDFGDMFLEKLISRTTQIKVGGYQSSPEPFMGSVISPEVALELIAAQNNLLMGNATSLLEMKSIQEGTGLLTPGIIDVSSCENIVDEEIFGPLIQVYRAANLEHAIDLANQTKYGLSAGIFCDDRQIYETVYARIKAGIINWNQPLTGALSSAPFGGVGLSGNHRPSAYYAADYCAYPIASLESEQDSLLTVKLPGLTDNE